MIKTIQLHQTAHEVKTSRTEVEGIIATSVDRTRDWLVRDSTVR